MGKEIVFLKKYIRGIKLWNRYWIMKVLWYISWIIFIFISMYFIKQEQCCISIHIICSSDYYKIWNRRWICFSTQINYAAAMTWVRTESRFFFICTIPPRIAKGLQADDKRTSKLWIIKFVLQLLFFYSFALRLLSIAIQLIYCPSSVFSIATIASEKE